VRTALALVAAVLATGWGVAHLFPTRTVVRDFGDIGEENRRTITMEWIYIGVTLMFAGLLTGVAAASATHLNGHDSRLHRGSGCGEASGVRRLRSAVAAWLATPEIAVDAMLTSASVIPAGNHSV
jgi:hypothetical protein